MSGVPVVGIPLPSGEDCRVCGSRVAVGVHICVYMHAYGCSKFVCASVCMFHVCIVYVYACFMFV